MRLLLGLVLGLALMAQPAVAGPKEEKKQEKAERKEQKSEPSAPAPAAEPQPEPKRAPAAAAKAPEQDRRTKTKPNRTSRQPQQPAPTPTASPSHNSTTVPAPNVPSAPAVPTAADVPAAKTPAPIAAPARPKRPARRERRPRERRPRRAVLGFTVSGATGGRTVVPVAAALAPLPRLQRRPSERPKRAPSEPRAQHAAPAPGIRATTAAVTRVVNVIPAPIRFALIGLTMLVVLLTVRARRLEHQRQDLSEDLGLLQSALLPALPERIGQAWISAAYRPAEGLAAGGDFYDAFALGEHRTCLLVGDVAGHGRDAIPLTADVRFTLRAYLEAGLGPRAALRATAAVIGPRLGGRLVTVVVAVLDARTGRLTYAAAGHPPPVLAGSGERFVTVASSPAIGAGIPTGHRQTTISLPAGETACFYTDGLSDVLAGGRRIGPAGVQQYLASLGRRADARTLLERIVRDTDSHPDDMAACLIRPQLGTSVPALERVEELELDRPDDGRAARFLSACGVPADEAEVALQAAHDLLPVVLEVRCGRQGGTVAVHRPDAASLPALPLA